MDTLLRKRFKDPNLSPQEAIRLHLQSGDEDAASAVLDKIPLNKDFELTFVVKKGYFFGSSTATFFGQDELICRTEDDLIAYLQLLIRPDSPHWYYSTWCSLFYAENLTDKDSSVTVLNRREISKAELNILAQHSNIYISRAANLYLAHLAQRESFWQAQQERLEANIRRRQQNAERKRREAAQVVTFQEMLDMHIDNMWSLYSKFFHLDRKAFASNIKGNTTLEFVLFSAYQRKIMTKTAFAQHVRDYDILELATKHLKNTA